MLISTEEHNNLFDLKAGSMEAFKKIFNKYFLLLERFAVEYLHNREDADDIVQSVFMTLWERRMTLSSDSKIVNYLITLTRNQCLNHLRHLKAQQNYVHHQEMRYEEILLNSYALESFNTDNLVVEELDKTIRAAIDSLPGSCREIFLMSRVNKLKYHEIADILKISVKTVEKKMSISLSILREQLREFYCFLWIV